MISADLVIVGAGSAGAVIATRMTERSDRQVLLVEAGPDYPEDPLPPDLLDGTRNSMRLHDWGFRHRPTPNQGLFRLPRGKVVGGSSAVNTCIALRGQPYDYDEWADLGLPQWSWEACLPAFKRLENDLDIRDQWHNQQGPIPIRRHTKDELVPWQQTFLDACAAFKFPPCPDHNHPKPTGYGSHPMNKIHGERMSVARCYLTATVRQRDNLTILPKALTRRVLIKNHHVTGIEIEHQGKIDVIHANRVILSAGAIGTPGILIRSGIGPSARVQRLGVELVVDLPAVGAKLLDHPGAAIFLVPRTLQNNWNHPLIQTMLRYTSENSPYPNDMQLQPGSFVGFPGFPTPLVSLMCCVGKPVGHGVMEWTSADPHAKPTIDSRLLVHPEDRARAVEAMELAWHLTRTPPMKDLIYYLWPGESVLRKRASISQWIGRSCDSGYHPSGTVPMGKEGDPGAALDGYGRVRGVDGLFVADASIMPTIPSVNINIPTIMIGERFGEWFRDGM